jgi:hypothetical protein
MKSHQVPPRLVKYFLEFLLILQFMVVVANLFIRYLEERVKVPWPVSEREAILHYFELEYLKEDVVIVIMKTVRTFSSAF